MTLEKKSILIAGGGSTYMPGFLLSLISHEDTFPIKKIVYYDIDEARQEKISKATEILLKERAPQIEFIDTVDPEEAFTDIDFVFGSVRVGGLPMREKDEKIPLKYDIIGQETCGPGGMAYGMRSIGPVLQLIDYMEKYSPNAWLLNYSNPIAIVAEACRRYRPNSNVINICDMPISLEERMAEILGMDSVKDLHAKYYGLNHYGWWWDVRDNDGNDVKPKLLQYIREHGYVTPKELEDKGKDVEASWLHTFEKAKDLAVIDSSTLPNTYLKYYLLMADEVNIANPDYTRANEVMDGREKNTFSEAKRIVDNETAVDSVWEEDLHAAYMVNLARAIAYNTYEKMILNVPNNGTVNNFSDDAIIELHCEVSSTGATPLKQPDIPTFQKGMMEQQVAVEKLVVDAWNDGSYEKMLQALSLSSTVPNAKVAKALLDDLIDANKEYWPELK